MEWVDKDKKEKIHFALNNTLSKVRFKHVNNFNFLIKTKIKYYSEENSNEMKPMKCAGQSSFLKKIKNCLFRNTNHSDELKLIKKPNKTVLKLKSVSE